MADVDAGKIEYTIEIKDDNVDKKLKEVNDGVKEVGEGVDGVSKTLENFNEDLEKSTDELFDFSKGLKDVNESAKEGFGGLDKNVKDGANALEDLSSGLGETNTGLDEVSNKASSFGDILKSGVALGAAGAALIAVEALKAIGQALVDLISNATQFSIEFESAFAGVKKTTDASAEEFEGIKNSLKELAAESGSMDLIGLTELAETAGQMGVAKEDLIDMTKILSDLNVATDIAGQEGATNFAKLATVSKTAADEYDNLASTIVSLGNNTAGTESEILNMANRTAQAGSNAKMSQADILGLSASMIDIGLSAEAGGNSFSRVLLDMQSAVVQGGDSLNNFANVAGVSAEEFKQSFEEDATGAFLQFLDGLSQAESRGTDAIVMLEDLGIASHQEVNTLLAMSDNLGLVSDKINMANQGWRENVALTNEVGLRNETTAAQMQMLSNSMDNISLAIGDKFNAMLGSLIPIFLDLSKSMSSLLDTTELTKKDLMSSISTMLTDAMTKFKNIAPQLTESGFNMLVNLIDGINAAIPSVIELIAVLVRQLLSGITSKLPEFLTSGVDLLTSIIEGMVLIIPQSLGAVNDMIRGLLMGLSRSNNAFLQSGINLLKSLVKGLVTIVVEVIRFFAVLIKDVIDGLKANQKSFKEMGSNIIKSLWNGIKELASWIRQQFSSLINDIIGGTDTTGGSKELAKTAAEDIKSSFKDNIGDITEVISDELFEDTNSLNKDAYDYGKDSSDNFIDGAYEGYESGGDKLAKGAGGAAKKAGNAATSATSKAAKETGAAAIKEQEKTNKELEKLEQEALKEREALFKEEEKLYLEFFSAIESALKEKYKDEFNILQDSIKEQNALLKEQYNEDLDNVKTAHEEKLKLYEEEHAKRLEALGIELDKSQELNNLEIEQIKQAQALRSEAARILKEEENIKQKEEDILNARSELTKLQSELYKIEDQDKRVQALEKIEKQIQKIEKAEKDLEKYRNELERNQIEREENARIKELEAVNKELKNLYDQQLNEEKDHYNNLKQIENDQNKKTLDGLKGNLEYQTQLNNNLLDEAKSLYETRMQQENIFGEAILIIQEQNQENMIDLLTKYNSKYVESGYKQGSDYITSQILGIEDNENNLVNKLNEIQRIIEERVAIMRATLAEVGLSSGSINTGASYNSVNNYSIIQNNTVSGNSPYAVKEELNSSLNNLSNLLR